MEERRRKSYQLAGQIAASRLFKTSQRIACYMAVNGEISLLPIMELAWSLGKEICLPVLGLSYNNKLWFAKYHANDPLVANKFGILEPVLTKKKRVAINSCGLVLMPLVAFDNKGNRLGMGGGYYDRSFAFLRQRKVWQKPRLMGVGYELQRVNSLVIRKWDVPMHAVATELSIR